ncbi:GTP cyclohydrolase 1 [Ureibacillus acetophenoni]
MSNVDLKKIEEAVKMILEAVGEDVNREGLLDTPKRVSKMYQEMFSGMNEVPREFFSTVFHEDHEELVLVKEIPFYSMCEHHLVRFYGKAHVAYIPRMDVLLDLVNLVDVLILLREDRNYKKELQQLLRIAYGKC